MGKKKVLLLAPDSFGLYKLIAENLAYLGYDVVHIQDRGYPCSDDTFGQRV
jgi:alpha-beta hydrolase superfamily lysophospholipase